MLFISSEQKSEFRRLERNIPLCSFIFCPKDGMLNCYKTARHHIPGENYLLFHCRENHGSHIYFWNLQYLVRKVCKHPTYIVEINSKATVSPLCSKCNNHRLKLGRNTGRILLGTLCNKSNDYGLKLGSNAAAIMTSAVCNYCKSAGIVSHSHTVHYIKSLIKTCKTQEQN